MKIEQISADEFNRLKGRKDDGKYVGAAELMERRRAGRPTSGRADGPNKDEDAFLDYLAQQVLAKRIMGFHFEGVTFRLADRTTYTPDVVVWRNDGSVLAVEIKGWLEDDASVKFKVARETFPAVDFVMFRKKRGEWREMLKPRPAANPFD